MSRESEHESTLPIGIVMAALRRKYELGGLLERALVPLGALQAAEADARSDPRAAVRAEAALALGAMLVVHGVMAGALTALGRAMEDLPEDAGALGSMAHLEYGRALSHTGEYGEAHAVFEEGLRRCEADTSAIHTAQFWISIGMIYGIRGEATPYAAHTERCLEIATRIGHVQLALNARINIAGAYISLKRFDEARTLYDQALTEARALGHVRMEGLALAGQGAVCGALGDLAGETFLLTASNAIFERQGDIFQVARQWLLAGDRALSHGDLGVARSHLERCQDLARERSLRGLLTMSLSSLATLCEREGDLVRALALVREADRLRAEGAAEQTELRLQVLRVQHQLEAARRENTRVQETARALAAHNAALSTALSRIEQQNYDLRAVLEAHPDAICVRRLGDRLWLNRAAGALFGRAPGDGPPPVGGARGVCDLLSWDARVRPVSLPAQGVTRADGGAATVSIKSVALDFEGEPAVLFAMHDLTEHARLEDEVRRLNHLAALATMAGGAAHEINNPLAIVLGNLEYVISAENGTLVAALDERREALDAAVHAGRRVREIVRSLRVFSALGRPKYLRVRLAEVVHRAVAAAMRAQLCPMGPAIDGEPDFEVETDPTLLAQALERLLENALQAVEGQTVGRVDLIVRRPSAAMFTLEVVDSGPGIPPELRERVFEPFFTTRPVGRGQGLGLSVCVGIVQALRGHIALSCPPEGGTRVRLELPVRAPDAVGT
jgi:signal transduction histidine kinase/PAS domain-containing protein